MCSDNLLAQHAVLLDMVSVQKFPGSSDFTGNSSVFHRDFLVSCRLKGPETMHFHDISLHKKHGICRFVGGIL